MSRFGLPQHDSRFKFQHNVVCHEEGPSGPLLVHRVPSAPPRWPNWMSNLEVQIWYSAWFSKIYLLVDICFCKCLTCVVLGLLRCRTCARPILCADDPEATLLKAHSCTNCITGFHVVSQWPAKTRAFELENATPGNPVAVRSSKKTLPTLALYSTLWTLRSFEHCRLWSEIGWPTPNAMRCQWPGSQGLKPVCCQTSARCERVHCQTYLIEHVGI